MERATIDWAARVDDAWLTGKLAPSTSGATGEGVRRPRSFMVTYFFNHQTHHQDRAGALVTALGEATGDSDLVMLLDGLR